MSMQKDHEGLLPDGGKCIAPESLSAELDGEYTFTEEELVHLKHCAKCRSLHESYKLLDDVLSHTLDVKCPEAVVKRVRKNVAYNTTSRGRLQEDERKGFDFIAWMVRAAAMIVLLGGASYLLWKDYTARKGSARKNIVSVSNSNLPPLAAPAKDNSQVLSSGKSHAVSSPVIPGGVDIRDLALISGGSGGGVRFVDSAAALQDKNATQKVERIDGNVQHVWLFDPAWKAPQTESIFRKVLKAASVPLNKIKFDLNDDGTLRSQLELTRIQAVLLVRALHKEGCTLVNAAQPQPEQKYFAGSGKELVLYNVLLTPKGK